MAEYVQLGAVKTWYDEHGSGDPLVLMHGGLADARFFEPNLEALAERFHVYTPERRGHGHTGDVPGPISYQLMTDDTIAFLEAVVGRPADLVGHSDGAFVAMLVAMQRPELVKRLVLISGGFNKSGEAVPDMEWNVDELAQFLGPAYGEVSPDGENHFKVVATKVGEMAAVEPNLQASDLSKVTQRSLVVFSDDDLMTLAHAVEMYDALPNAELAIVPGTSHFLTQEKPQLVNKLVLDFLSNDPCRRWHPSDASRQAEPPDRVARPGLKGPMGTLKREMRLTFESEGEALVGNLFLPEGAEPAGIVVAVGPLTSVKEQAAGTYAKAMAERGHAALAFDYRYFGESEGRPRQFENPEANIEDIKNAASALLVDDRLAGLPLFGLGVCFGAGPMVRAVAGDPRFRAFAGVAGVYTDNAKTKANMGDAYRAKIERGRAAERRWLETGEAETIPAVAPDGGDVAMPLREAYEFYGTPRGGVPNYVNGYAVQSLAYSLPFDARGAADAINVPVLIVHSEKALAPDLAHAFYAAVKSPKQELWFGSQGQIDFYDDPKLIAPAAEAVGEFLAERHL